MNLMGFAAKNALRNRFRTTLTVLGVAVAIVAFVLLRTIITSWSIAAQSRCPSATWTRYASPRASKKPPG
jgi:putative ABC transport system permease protein